MKAALTLRGLPGGYPRPPYLPLDDEEHAMISAFMAELGFVKRTPETSGPHTR